MNVGELDLTAEEDTAPFALPPPGSTNLWSQSGWVRGTWPASLNLFDPSGVCSSGVSLGNLVQHPLVDQVANRNTFVQCSQSMVPASFDTATVQTSDGIGTGTAQLGALAKNAAGMFANPTKTVRIDNTTPAVTFSGPTDVPATGVAMDVTATATGSPSGIADLVCSLDGGPPRQYDSNPASVGVNGVGTHTVSCYAENNAVDPAGVHGRSATVTRTLKIGQPTELGLAFNRFVGGLHCGRIRIRQRIPGHWVTIHRHGNPVWVKTKARTVTRSIVRCHPTTALRRTVVIARVRRNGRLVTVKRVKVERVVIPPHTVSRTVQRVAFGRTTVVSGWLGTSSGAGLAGRPVTIITAPDDGRGDFGIAARATTAADGSWSARLPAGPSRFIEARYDGDPTTESASSGTARVIVPARLRLLSVRPSRVSWGGQVRLTGRLLGGDLPAGGALVRLRIGIGRSYQTYGVAHVKGSGLFSTTYTFGLGDASVRRTYFFQIATLPEGDYPYAAGASGRRFVTVGG